MPKSLNKDQIAMLDKEVQKLDKKLSNKDMEKAMGMLMKNIGIKESDLDELSMTMKSMTKSGISKDVGVDKDKLKMSLKDLRKKLDKKKDEANIVRSKKGVAALRRKSAEENPKIRKEAQIDELAPLALIGPAAGAIARVAGPAIVKNAPKIARGIGNIFKKGSKTTGKVTGNIAKKATKTVVKNPVKSTAIGGAAALSTDKGQKVAGDAAKSLAKKAIGSTAGKIALGVGGAYAAKKTYDAMRNRKKERDAERDREQARRQVQRQNDA